MHLSLNSPGNQIHWLMPFLAYPPFHTHSTSSSRDHTKCETSVPVKTLITKLSGIEFNKQEATYKNIESEKWHTKAEIAFAAKRVLHIHQRGESMFSSLSSWLSSAFFSVALTLSCLLGAPSSPVFLGPPRNCAVISGPFSEVFLDSCDI